MAELLPELPTERQCNDVEYFNIPLPKFWGDISLSSLEQAIIEIIFCCLNF